MRGWIAAGLLTCAVAVGAAAPAARADTGPPPGTPHGAAKSTLYATGGRNLTSFAWGDGVMFAGDSGAETAKVPNGGLDVIRSGKVRRLRGGPVFVGGMAWHDGALYLSDEVLVDHAPRFQIERLSGWTGQRFTRRTVLYVGPSGFEGFDGLAFGPDGRLYVGVSTGLLNFNDHGPASTSPFLYDILAMSATGSNVSVFATGIRQPWQMAFAKGSADPFVSDLGQDGPAAIEQLGPPDLVLRVVSGDDFGFPNCSWTPGSDCSGDAMPFERFTPHTDIMGLAVVGSTLYMGSYQGRASHGGGAVFATSVHGGAVRPVVTGFPAATDALAAHDGVLYAGGSNRAGGLVYRVKP